jgi:hypothetical protein
MRSYVSGEGEVGLKCFRTLPDGASNLPFYRLREGSGVHEREKRGTEGREKLRGREPWGYAALLRGQVLLTKMKEYTRRDLVRFQCYRQVPPSWSWPPVHHCHYRQPPLARGMVNKSLCRSHTGIEQHSAGLPGTIGDVGA